MDKYRIFEYWNRTRDSLLASVNKELWVFLFFLFLSSVFWLLQTLDETFDTEITIPIELTDVPEDIVIISSLPDALHVSVHDKGVVLLRYWKNGISPIQLSFSDCNCNVTQGHGRISPSDIQNAVQERLLATTKVQAIRPDTLEFYYNYGQHVTVPVKVAGSVDVESHHYLLDLSTEPSEVKVFASSLVLDTLTAVQTQPVKLSGLQENTTLDVDLHPIRGARIEPSRVKLTAKVDVYMENTIEVPLISLNFPGDKQLRTFPSTVRVTYTVGYAHNKEIARDNFVIVVTYEDILELQQRGISRIPLHVKSIPEGVKNVRIDPGEVDYLIESVGEVD